MASTAPVAAEAVATNAPANRPAAICMDQGMDIAADGRKLQQCLGTTRTVRNGSILTHRAEPQDPNGTWLNIEVGGKTIFGAEIGSGTHIGYQCSREQCAGISVGPYDTQGGRSIILSNATLFRESAAHPGKQETALITGQIKVLPDDQSASTTCVGQVLLISLGSETVHFCPDAGTGFDVDEDGGATFKFTNGDGASVAVSLDRQGELRHVAYAGYSCETGACRGISVSTPDSAGSRTFAFHGTMLLQNGTDAASALLNGNLILDSQ